jgi:hypothetical protein
MSDITPELEAVARALFETENKNNSGVLFCSWDKESDKTYWFESARAALTAIREPTEGMHKAIYDAWEYHANGAEIVKIEWRAAIDHILGTKP